MIYYFSGTGNSSYIAEQASTILSDSFSSIITPSAFSGDSLGLIFPVYAWGLPSVLEDFISCKLQKLLGGKMPQYVYAIMTHGDDMGYADTILRNELSKAGLPLHAAFSLAMPNTYVCLPGFDIDKEELAKAKVQASTNSLRSVCTSIKNREGACDVTRGAIPFTKTYVLRPLFNRFLVTDRYFRSTTPQCTMCGKCAKQCPLNNIELSAGQVRWNGNCTGCLRCYHLCPNNAIQFGKFTKGKGQKQHL